MGMKLMRRFKINEMDKTNEDVKRLKQCIDYWTGIQNGDECLGAAGCALCQEYLTPYEVHYLNSLENHKINKMKCKECPIYKEDSEHRYCFGTPYDDWMIHLGKDHHQNFLNIVYCSVCEKHIKDELSLLKHIRAELKLKARGKLEETWNVQGVKDS